jgi:uncharacterized protein HemX
MRSSGTGWGAELFIVFISGFLLATVLWLGLWFFWTKPAQAAILQAKEAALMAKETALLNCVAAKDQCDELRDKLQAENKQIDTKLKEALNGWGNCIRSKSTP